MTHRRGLVRPLAIRHVALMTIEGQNDDICGVGQTEAAHGLCGNLSASMREHYVQPEVGHYGLFSGSRFRRDIAPRISEFISKPKAPLRGRLAACQRRMTERAIPGRQPQQSRRTRNSSAICHGKTFFSDRLVVRPAKAGMFSKSWNLPGQKSGARSLDSRLAGNEDPEAYRHPPWGDYESPGRNKSERGSGLEKSRIRGPQPQPEGEGSMGSRNLIDAATSPRRGGMRQHGDKDMPSNWRSPPRPDEKNVGAR